MADEQTADQVRAEHLDKLGPQLGPVFSELRDDLTWLQVKWGEYRALYGTSPERIDLMNSAAGLFFRILQDTIWENALLHLCRLTDPAVISSRHNLSIRALPELCGDAAVREAVRTLVGQAVAATSFARDWRNRHIGHRDRALALGSGTRPLAPASRAQLSAAIGAIHRVLNEISERLMGSTLADEVITPPTGAEALLYVLRDGLKADAERRERIRSGKFTLDDLRRDPV
jgi:hypothetical protein